MLVTAISWLKLIQNLIATQFHTAQHRIIIIIIFKNEKFQYSFLSNNHRLTLPHMNKKKKKINGLDFPGIVGTAQVKKVKKIKFGVK
jgi:hypothetical protein